jgi:hypothetical protein
VKNTKVIDLTDSMQANEGEFENDKIWVLSTMKTSIDPKCHFFQKDTCKISFMYFYKLLHADLYPILTKSFDFLIKCNFKILSKFL